MYNHEQKVTIASSCKAKFDLGPGGNPAAVWDGRGSDEAWGSLEKIQGERMSDREAPWQSDKMICVCKIRQRLFKYPCFIYAKKYVQGDPTRLSQVIFFWQTKKIQKVP